MKKFFDVVKTKLDEDTEMYFQNVEVESIKKTKNNDALNFYLISHDLIPYDVIKDAEKITARDILNMDIKENADESPKFRCPIRFNFRYELTKDISSREIYELTKKDIFKFLKEDKPTAISFLRDEYIEFTDDNTLQLGFDHIKSFEKQQSEIVDYFKAYFKLKFDKDINVNILWLEKYDPNKEKDINEDLVKNDKEETNGKSNEVDNNVKTSYKPSQKNISSNASYRHTKRRSMINADGDVLYGKVSRAKRTYKPISELLYEIDNIETEGVIYNLNVFISTKKEIAVYSIYVTDNENCIEIKFFGSVDDVKLFYDRFSVGTEIKVAGRVVNDTYAKALTINPFSIVSVGKRTVIEYGKVGEPDYYNEIITDREDNEKDKRVELHLHTKSSAQDGIGDVKQYILTAKKFGMTAMAITDHGCVNALADASDYLTKTLKDKNFKLINGVEGYLVEDINSFYHDSFDEELNESYGFDDEYVIYNIITTGYNRLNDGVLKIEAVKIKGKTITDNFSSFVKYDKNLSLDIKDKTGIMPSDVKNALELKTVLSNFTNFIGDACLVNIQSRTSFSLIDILKQHGFDKNYRYLDFSILARLVYPDIKNVTVEHLAHELNIKVEGSSTKKKTKVSPKMVLLLYADILVATFDRITTTHGISDISKLKEKYIINDDIIKRQKYYHIVILAKNDVGRINLYKLVSDSHIKYMFNKRPRIPRSLLSKYREGLILGSACILGEFMDAIKNNYDDEELKKIASFYDYLEVQPTLNNSFLLNDEPENFKSILDLEKLNKKVVKIGDELNIPVVATCDCHYVEKDDKIYREVLRAGISSKKSNQDRFGNLKAELSSEMESTNQEELYFRTTKEMLDEFAYLGLDKAYEVVVKNTNLISDMIDKIYPVRLDKCPPHIKGSDEELVSTCHNNLYKIFGDNPPAEIKERLDSELKYIIDNGYSVMYITAKKLIDYSKENGYPVGSRGSVGSSLAAFFSGVSEVNPLKPYYICPKCHYIEYDSEDTRKYENDTGFDMPDKMCPHCNTKLNKDGINIPFETFLGIPGVPSAQKEPDIDLNFCTVFQSKIHEKTIDIFGKDNTFKAGTVGTIAAKTAYGYVMRFKEMTGLDLNKNQIDFYKNKIVDCKNTTGQHPGGMVVVPEGELIYTFTPIQIAADKEGNNVTTHYDYHKIDDNLLKLDILGHQAPLMLKKLSELTGVDYNTVPFYEEDVLKLFENTESLGITPNDISDTKLGCLTIPEFGTDFAMNMCLEAKPKTVADLIRIAGLAHGTDVWQGNVEELIKNGDCTLSSAICCRDDIMLYLEEKGLDSGTSFNIMERVRKGKKLTDQYREEMRKYDVPEWYIGCCDKIQYMFPKAHAAAYVLASLRIAYYKVHYPLEYYAAYFSIDKEGGFDYKLMMKNREEIHYRIEKIRKVINERKEKDRKFAVSFDRAEKPLDLVKKMYQKLNGETQDEEEIELDENSLLDLQYQNMSAKKLFDLYMCYRHVEEMLSRSIEFCPIDIYKAKRSDFTICDGKIMPSFDSIAGIGTKDDVDFDANVKDEDKSTAMKCEIEGRKGDYSSIENFIKRTGVHSTQINEMKEMGLFGDLREKEDITVFDYI